MSLEFYVCDTETTGMSTEFHEIVEYSIVRCSDRAQLSRMIKAEFPERAQQAALEITGKSRADLKIGIPREQAVLDFVNFLNQDKLSPEHRCIIAHVASFDRRFLHTLFAQHNQCFPANLWLDTKSLVRTWLKKNGIVKPKLTLEACLQQTGIKGVSGKHNAISDSQNTYILWVKAGESKIDYLPHIKRVPHILNNNVIQDQSDLSEYGD